LSCGDLSEAERRILKGLLPTEAGNQRRGRCPEQNRAIINGIVWWLRSGTLWREVPLKYGYWNTIYRCFRRCSEAGVWEVLALTLAEVMVDLGHTASIAARACLGCGRKGGGIYELSAAFGAGSRVSFTAWLMPSDDQSPSI
jgi:transposase